MCDWELFSTVRAGSLSAARQTAFDTALTRARQEYDLRAATVAGVALDPDPRVGYARLVKYVRTGPGDGRPRHVAKESKTVTLIGMVDALRDTEAHTRMSFLEVDVRGLTLSTATDSIPDLAPVWSRLWNQVCAEVPGHHEKQLFQLAGGVGRAPVSRTAWRAAVAEALDQLAAHVVRPLILVEPPAGWVLLEQAARAALRRLAPDLTLPWQSSLTDLNRLSAHLMAGVPRPEGYDVLLGWPGTTGIAEARPQRVLPRAVVAPGDTRSEQVVVYGPPHGSETLVPVVRHGADPADPAAVVDVAALTLGPGEQAMLTVRQEGPGTVRIVHPAARPGRAAWASAAHLEDLLRLDESRTEVDVLVTVELGQPVGQNGSVSDRLGVARTVVGDLARMAGRTASVRAAVVGYGDHLRRGLDVDLVQQGLGDPRDALARLAEMRPLMAARGLTAPLEEALAVAVGLDWRPAARKVIVVLAGRPAHPAQQKPSLIKCLADLDLDRLVAALPPGAEIIPALTGPAAERGGPGGRAGGGWADEVWALLSPRTPVMSAPHLQEVLEQLLAPDEEPINLRLALGEPVP
ncbi:hypothetical protein Areg01_81040 [Actinoplanes regularis]|nr:hypothetical protein Areg01_81040 [Actinoplanes regularis]